MPFGKIDLGNYTSKEMIDGLASDILYLIASNLGQTDYLRLCGTNRRMRDILLNSDDFALLREKYCISNHNSNNIRINQYSVMIIGNLKPEQDLSRCRELQISSCNNTVVVDHLLNKVFYYSCKYSPIRAKYVNMNNMASTEVTRLFCNTFSPDLEKLEIACVFGVGECCAAIKNNMPNLRSLTVRTRSMWDGSFNIADVSAMDMPGIKFCFDYYANVLILPREAQTIHVKKATKVISSTVAEEFVVHCDKLQGNISAGFVDISMVREFEGVILDCKKIKLRSYSMLRRIYPSDELLAELKTVTMTAFNEDLEQLRYLSNVIGNLSVRILNNVGEISLSMFDAKCRDLDLLFAVRCAVCVDRSDFDSLRLTNCDVRIATNVRAVNLQLDKIPRLVVDSGCSVDCDYLTICHVSDCSIFEKIVPKKRVVVDQDLQEACFNRFRYSCDEVEIKGKWSNELYRLIGGNFDGVRRLKLDSVEIDRLPASLESIHCLNINEYMRRMLRDKQYSHLYIKKYCEKLFE